MHNVKDSFINQNENLLGVLGNSYLQTFLSSGMIGNGFALLSDKRVYFRGNCLYKSNNRYYTSTQEKSIDLENVTGTGFEIINPIHFLIISVVLFFISASSLCLQIAQKSDTANHRTYSNSQSDEMYNLGIIICFIILYFAVLYLVKYKTGKKSVFRIDYAGGNIAFNLNFISYIEAQEFNRTLRLAKDNIKEILI